VALSFEDEAFNDIYAFMYFFSFLVDDFLYQYIIMDEQLQTTNKTGILQYIPTQDYCPSQINNFTQSIQYPVALSSH